MRGRISATMAVAFVTAFVSLLIILTVPLDRAAMLMGFIPARFAGELGLSPAVPVLLTPLSSTLVHANFLHLATNLLLLVWCGRQVETVIGAGPLLLLYVVGAYVAAAAQWLLDPSSLLPMVGASGAVSALIGAFAVSFGKSKRIVNAPRLNRWLNIAWLMLAWVILQWMLAYLMGMQGILVGTGAHVGGFIAGVVLQRPLLLWRYRGA